MTDDYKIYCTYHNDSLIFEYNLNNLPNYVKLFKANDLNILEDNINYLNPYLNELCTYYYVWKNQIYSKYVGFCHYRRFYRKIDFDNLNKYNVHCYGCINASINELIDKDIYTKKDNDLLYNYLKSLNIFDENILYKYFYTNIKINLPWRESFIFTWEFFNKFCELLFGFLDFYMNDYKNINNYNSGRCIGWKCEKICGIIVSLLINNIDLNNTNWKIYYNKVLLTESNDVNKIKLWGKKNNRTTANLYVLSKIEDKNLFDSEEIILINDIKEIPNWCEIIKININQYIECKEPNDFNTNNFIIKNIN